MDAIPTPTDPPVRILATSAGPIAVAEEGDPRAPAVVCSHGLPGSVRDFRYLAPCLAERWRVVRVDMPGFGGSPGAPGTAVGDWAAALVAVTEALELARPALLAHSFSGGAVMLAAASDPRRFRGLALLASLAFRPHRAMRWTPRTYRRLARFSELPGVGSVLAVAVRGLYRSLRIPPPDGRGELLLHLRLIGSVDFGELAAAASSLPLPVLAVAARDDRLSEPAIQDELAEGFPNAERLVFDSGGHHLQKHRAREVAEAVGRRLLDGDLR